MRLNFCGVSVHITRGVTEEELIEAEEEYSDVSMDEDGYLTVESAEKRDRIEDRMYKRGYVTRYDSEHDITIFVPEE